MRLIRRLPILALLCAALAAQDDPSEQGKTPPAPPNPAGEPLEKIQSAEAADGTGVVTAGAKDTLSSLCAVLPNVRPHRISEQQGGQIVLVLALTGDAVITADAKLNLEYETRQGPFTLGSWVLQPPRAGVLPTKFAGQPVYDNTATVEIPIAVAPGTRHGKYPVKLKVEVPLTHAHTANLVGLHRAEPSVDVVVGAPVPQPVLVPLRTPNQATGAAAAVSEAPGTGAPRAGSTPVGAEGRSGAPAGARTAKPQAAQDSERDAAGQEPEVYEEGGTSRLPIFVGAGLVGLVVLLLIAKSLGNKR
ncbi:MAG: hypothetical protein IT458_03265 [Planctomycetes bacterium]|nr:hypothetical protein [Planctomycetota bacterium]